MRPPSSSSGGGPAGLAAATALGSLGAGPVLVLERETEPGGIPRHADHQGFGARDLRRVLRGPDYARALAARARAAGAEIRTETMVDRLGRGRRRSSVTGPGRPRALTPRAVVLATGCRERPRAARLVPGHPAGRA